MEVGLVVRLTIIGYLIFILGNGFYSYFKVLKSKDAKGFVLGGNELSPWVLSMSEKASESSGYMTMGLPGEASTMGFSVSWAAVVSYFSLFNWFFMAKPLRRMSEIFNSITITDYLQKRFADKGNAIRVIGVVIIAIFLVVYVGVQYIAMGLLFELLFGMSFEAGVILGAVICISYTVVGGFTSVARNDFIQGIILFFGLGIMPLLMIPRLGGLSAISSQLIAANGEAWLLPYFGEMSLSSLGTLLLIISYVGIGVGFVGSPHIVVRYMATKSKRDITKMAIIGAIWMVVSYYGAILIGMFGTLLDITVSNPENIMMISAIEMFPGVIAGLLIAASLAAILSSADSMLLVAASSVAEDLFNNVIYKGKLSDNKVININRITIVVLGVLGILFAINPMDSIFWLAVFAWAGLACCFGPVIILSLYWKNVTRQGAIAGMLSGPIVAVAWYFLAKPATGIYEGLPGFIVSLLIIWIVSILTKNTGIPNIKDEWDLYTRKTEVGTPYPLDSDVEAAEEALSRIETTTKTQNDIVDFLSKNKLVSASKCEVVEPTPI